MTTIIKGLTQEHETFIIQTIKNFFPKAEIIVFGSRITGKHKKYSDVDICIKADKALDLSKWSQMEEVFAESALTVLVDISDYHLLTEDFRKHVLNTGVPVA